MTNTIKITNLPDGGVIIEDEDGIVVYSVEEIAEMERDYKDAIRRVLARSEYLSQRSNLSKIRTVKEAKHRLT